MGRTGTVSSWSPELASGLRGNPDRFSLGNIRDASIDELLETPQAQRTQAQIDAGVDMCRRQCEHFGVCGGGGPGNKFFERGTFATTETLKCVLQVQEFTEVMLSVFARPAASTA